MILSKGNMKIGQMFNISLTPVKACGEPAKHCGKACYAKKAHRMYPATRKAWDHNLEHVTRDRIGFFMDLYAALEKENEKAELKFFRWHVGGDILDDKYFFQMTQIAALMPQTKFLVFTKQYAIINNFLNICDGYPENLTVIFSAWPGLPMDNPHHLPVAWMQDGTEKRVTGEEILCPGNCESCGMCWDIRKVGKDVVFHKH